MEIKKVQFPDLASEEKGGRFSEKALNDIPIPVTVELGHTELSLRDILELGEGSIVSLDRLAGEPLDLKVGGQLIAQGEVVAIDDNYGLRITNVFVK